MTGYVSLNYRKQNSVKLPAAVKNIIFEKDISDAYVEFLFLN